MGFCKPMSEEVPLINTKTISKEELDAQRENAAKVQAVLQSRYTDKPLACVITYGCQQNVADGERMKGMLSEMGFEFTEDEDEAGTKHSLFSLTPAPCGSTQRIGCLATWGRSSPIRRSTRTR